MEASVIAMQLIASSSLRCQRCPPQIRHRGYNIAPNQQRPSPGPLAFITADHNANLHVPNFRCFIEISERN